LVFLGQMEPEKQLPWKCSSGSPRLLREKLVAGYNVKSATEMVKKSIGYMSKNSPCMMTWP
jgi:hypothetical protein